MGSAIAVVGLVACGIIVTATKNPITIAGRFIIATKALAKPHQGPSG